MIEDELPDAESAATAADKGDDLDAVPKVLTEENALEETATLTNAFADIEERSSLNYRMQELQRAGAQELVEIFGVVPFMAALRTVLGCKRAAGAAPTLYEVICILEPDMAKRPAMYEEMRRLAGNGVAQAREVRDSEGVVLNTGDGLMSFLSPRRENESTIVDSLGEFAYMDSGHPPRTLAWHQGIVTADAALASMVDFRPEALKTFEKDLQKHGGDFFWADFERRQEDNEEKLVLLPEVTALISIIETLLAEEIARNRGVASTYVARVRSDIAKIATLAETEDGHKAFLAAQVSLERSIVDLQSRFAAAEARSHLASDLQALRKLTIDSIEFRKLSEGAPIGRGWLDAYHQQREEAAAVRIGGMDASVARQEFFCVDPKKAAFVRPGTGSIG